MRTVLRTCALLLLMVIPILLSSVQGSAANPPDKYALFICGGVQCAMTVPCEEGEGLRAFGEAEIKGFWAGIATWIKLLTTQYCYDPDKIYLCWIDGQVRQLDCDRYELPDEVLDNLNIYHATKDSVLMAFSEITERADSNDVLFCYLSGHGNCDGDRALLCLWNAEVDSVSQHLQDIEFGALLDSVSCRTKIVVAQQCFPGPFKDQADAAGALSFSANDFRPSHGADDINSAPTCQSPGGDAGDPWERDACGWSDLSELRGGIWGNIRGEIRGQIGGETGEESLYQPIQWAEYSYHLLNALRGKTVGFENPLDADTNNDGWLSLGEAHAYACSTNSFGNCSSQKACYPTNLEAPQVGTSNAQFAPEMCLGGRIDLASGPLCRNPIMWSDTVTVTGDVVVPEGDTLIVRPGAVVLCDSLDDRAGGQDTSNVEIIVYGTLLAEGTSQNPIKFTSRVDPAPGQMGEGGNDIWRGITFVSGSSGNLAYCTVRRAYYAVECDSASPTIEYSAICDNQVAGIRCSGTAAPVIAEGDSIGRSYRGILCVGHSAPVIQGNVVIDSCNVGILAQGYSTPLIRDCRIKRCRKGISVSSHSAPTIGSGCDIFGNWEDGILLNVDNGGISIDSCTVRDNYGYGIRCQWNTGVTISHSAIHGNTEGVTCLGSADCLLGQASPEQAGFNNIYDNDDCNVNNSTTGGDTLLAENCWWGSSTPDTSKICGAVDYQPYLTSEVELARQSTGPEVVGIADKTACLGGIFPIPFRQHLAVPYVVRSPGADVRISVFNVQGQEVKVLVNRWTGPGRYTANWDGVGNGGENLPSGVYFCVLRQDGSVTEARKLVIVGGGAQ